MKKRGQLVYKGLIIAIVCVMVILAFIQAGKSYGSKDIFYKSAVAKDLALIIDELYAVPGDVVISYQNDLSEYGVYIKDNSVRVYSTDAGLLDVTSGQYTFFGLKIQETKIENPKQLIISKVNGKITLSAK